MVYHISEISGARDIAKSTCHKRRGKRDGRNGERQGERKKDSDRGRSKKHWHVLVPENARYLESRLQGGRFRERQAIELLKEAEKGAKRARNAKRK